LPTAAQRLMGEACLKQKKETIQATLQFYRIYAILYPRESPE